MASLPCVRRRPFPLIGSRSLRVWLIALAGHVNVWSGPDLLVTVAVDLAFGALMGLGGYWQWSLAETCGSRLWSQVNETWPLVAANNRNGEAE